MRKPTGGGGWQAICYTLRKAREVGFLRLWRAMAAKNACKTCALGMGGQVGGMRNESGHFPEFCKKSLQAMVADMRGRIEPRFFSSYTLRQLQTFSPRDLELLGRLTEPIYLAPGGTHYESISWADALKVVSGALKKTAPERAFFYSSGRSSNEAGFLMQLFARVYGTNHVSNCSYYCHQASGAGLMESLGTPTATVSLEDLDQCDCVFLIGGNPASNHPRLMSSLLKIRGRGGQVVVVNPMRELGLERFKVPSNVRSMLGHSEIASLYVQPAIGGDIALMAGIAKTLIERGDIDRGFVESSTTDFDALAVHVDRLTWAEIEAASNVDRHTIEATADVYARSERTIFAWTMGITHHEHGTENVQWIVNLALLRGMVGKPGAGLMPIRGHSNVQGLGTIGVAPMVRQAAVDALASLGVKVPDWKGHDTLASIEAAHRGEMDFALCLGGNLFGANPDAQFAERALASVETVVYLTTTLNTGHMRGLGKGTLVLPVLARDEESQATTQESMFSYVRLSDGGPARYPGPRSEVHVIADIALETVGTEPLDWQNLKSHDEIRVLIARLVPNLKDIDAIGRTKIEFHIPGRIFRKPAFKTPSGRARFRPHPIPSLPALGERQMRLMTIRSEGQFNTVVYEEEDLYRGQERRDIILMHPMDLERLGLRQDQWVEVVSEVGRMTAMARPFDIARGCAAMYYPEANILVPRRADPRSRTPAFKSVIVSISPAESGSVFTRDQIVDSGAVPRKLKAC